MRLTRIVPLLLALAFASGCACWQPAHAQDLSCVVTHQVVDCTESSGIAVGPAIAGLLSGFITGGQINWAVVENAAKSFGFKDGGCFLASLETDFTQKSAMQKIGKMAPGHEGINYSMHAASAHSAMTSWRTRNNATNIKFKVKNAAGEVTIL